MNAPRRIPYLALLAIGVVAVFVILVLAGRVTWFSEQPPVEFLDNMDLNKKAIPQSANGFFSDRRSQRDPVEGTVARGLEYVDVTGEVEITAGGAAELDLRLERWIDLAAPGDGITGAVPGGWGIWSGTSMAAPMVAGSAALVRAAAPAMSAKDVARCLVRSGRKLIDDSRLTGLDPLNVLQQLASKGRCR